MHAPNMKPPPSLCTPEVTLSQSFQSPSYLYPAASAGSHPCKPPVGPQRREGVATSSVFIERTFMITMLSFILLQLTKWCVHAALRVAVFSFSCLLLALLNWLSTVLVYGPTYPFKRLLPKDFICLWILFLLLKDFIISPLSFIVIHFLYIYCIIKS